MHRRRALIPAVALIAALSAPGLSFADTAADPPNAGSAAESMPTEDASAEARPEAAPEAEGEGANPAVEDPASLAQELVAHVRAGAWFAAAGAALLLVVALVRWLARKRSLGKSKGWGYVLAFGTALAVSLGAGMMEGALSWELVVGALGVAWVAGGQLEGATDFGRWVVRKLK